MLDAAKCRQPDPKPVQRPVLAETRVSRKQELLDSRTLDFSHHHHRDYGSEIVYRRNGTVWNVNLVLPSPTSYRLSSPADQTAKNKIAEADLTAQRTQNQRGRIPYRRQYLARFQPIHHRDRRSSCLDLSSLSCFVLNIVSAMFIPFKSSVI